MTNQNSEEIKEVPQKDGQIEKERAVGEKGQERKIEKEDFFSYDKYDKIVLEKLRKEIDLMESDERAKKEAKKKAEKIEFLAEKEKIEQLLKIARERGVAFSVQVAKKINDPYLLDIFHDILAQEGFYKKIAQKTDDDDDKK